MTIAVTNARANNAVHAFQGHPSAPSGMIDSPTMP
jgi:hypothetical protein